MGIFHYGIRIMGQVSHFLQQLILDIWIPLIFFFLVFPDYIAWSGIVIFQTLSVLVALYFYCRSLKLSKISSFFVTAVFIFSSPVITRMELLQYNEGTALFIFLLFLIEQFRNKPRKIFLFLTSITTAIMLFSTHPQYVMYFFVFIFFYWLLRLRKIQFLFMILLGIGVAAVQLFPAIEFLRYTNLNVKFSEFIFRSFLVPFSHLLTIFVPNYFGNPSTYNFFGGGDYLEAAVSIGLIPSLFAFLFLFTQRETKHESIKKFFLAVTVISILASVDWIGSRFIYGLKFPLFSIGVPSRLLFFTTFSIAVLSGFGLEILLSEGLTKVKKQFWFFGTFVLILLFYTTGVHKICPGFIRNCNVVSLKNTLLEICCFLLAISLLLLTIHKKEKLRSFGIGTLLAITIGLGAYNSYKYLPFSNKDSFAPQNDLISFLQLHAAEGRAFGLSQATIKTDFATGFGFF